MPRRLKRLLFRLHWLLGLSAGLVLAVVGVTGALLSYQQELLDWMNPLPQLQPDGREPMALDALLAVAAAAHPQLQVLAISAAIDPAAALEVRLGRPGERGGTQQRVDRYRGDLLPEQRGAGFFQTCEQLHRFLAAGPLGKQLVGASTLALIVLAVSGVLLRWPRRWYSPRAWLALDTGLRGRSLLWHLHAVAGAWCLLFYLSAAGTGLWWSYEFYRNAINDWSGVPLQPPPVVVAAAPSGRVIPSLQAAWRGFQAAAPEAQRYSLQMPVDPTRGFEWRYLNADSAHPRAFDSVTVDANGRLLRRQRYAELPPGRRLVASMLPLHSGSWFGAPGRLGMALASLLMPLFVLTGFWLWLQRRSNAVVPPPGVPRAHDGEPVELWYASQSGTAERIAWQTAGWLQQIGLQVQVRSLAQWCPPSATAATALFVVASYGEGDPPDSALDFARRWLRQAGVVDLSRLRCAVLALGNQRYVDFCGFGRRLGDWLHGCGAGLAFPRIDSHEGDPASLQRWRDGLAQRWPALDAAAQSPDAAATPWQAWRIDARRALNPQSSAARLFELQLLAVDEAAADWRPGDLLEVDFASAGSRRYSIANAPEPGVVRLLVRCLHSPDGLPGLASHALGHALSLGTTLSARIQPSSDFAPPPADRPVILIANGVGIAPFLALLQLRRRQAGAPAWLIYGERDADTDDGLLHELDGYRSAGELARLDLAWSRGSPARYVQDVLAALPSLLRDWLDCEASLLVCGSPQMGAAVESVLVQQFGAARVELLRRQGRYRRELF